MPNTDVKVNELIINKLTREQYDNIDTPSETELYFITDESAGASNLSELNDVNITTPTDGQSLVYDSATSKWINGDGGSDDNCWEQGTGTGAIITKANADSLGEATGNNSVAEGYNTFAWADNSHAEGNATKIFSGATSAHAEGVGSNARGLVSHVEGQQSNANGDVSHAEGGNTTSVGDYSHTEGNSTVANNPYEHAEGHFNKSNIANNTYGDAGNTIHSIGIGNSLMNSKNAMEVMQNGDTYIYGVGNYDGTNISDADTIQEVIEDKQDKLIAGSNIAIASDGRTISATGGGGSGSIIQDVGNISGDTTIDLSLGTSVIGRITGDCNISLSDVSTGGKSMTVNLIIKNGGNFSVTWNRHIRWGNDTKPRLTKNGIDSITLITLDNGINWYSTAVTRITDYNEDPLAWSWNNVEYDLYNGRKYARHPSNKGTVFSMNDGTERAILVLDAAYRSIDCSYFSKYTINILPLLPIEAPMPQYKINNKPLFGSARNFNWGGVSDDVINSTPTYAQYCNADTNTSTYNTNALYSLAGLGEGEPEAAIYCKNLEIDGIYTMNGYVIPNINVQARLISDNAKFDELDPTAVANPNLKMSASKARINSSYYGNYASETVSGYAFESISTTSTITASFMNSKQLLIPILELREY